MRAHNIFIYVLCGNKSCLLSFRLIHKFDRIVSISFEQTKPESDQQSTC